MPPKTSPSFSGKLPDIWCEKSPIVKMVAQRFERKGLHTWNNDRLSALARKLNKTIWILCAEAGAFKTVYDAKMDLFRLEVDRVGIRRYWRDNHWPVWLTLHFERFEQYAATHHLEPGAVLLGVADVAAAKMLRK